MLIMGRSLGAAILIPCFAMALFESSCCRAYFITSIARRSSNPSAVVFHGSLEEITVSELRLQERSRGVHSNSFIKCYRLTAYLPPRIGPRKTTVQNLAENLTSSSIILGKALSVWSFLDKGWVLSTLDLLCCCPWHSTSKTTGQWCNTTSISSGCRNIRSSIMLLVNLLLHPLSP